MCKKRKQIEQELHETGNEVWQDKPFAAVSLTATYANKEYTAIGFSKVCWPDWWNRARGIQIARGKALAKISRQIVDEQGGDATLTPAIVSHPFIHFPLPAQSDFRLD